MITTIGKLFDVNYGQKEYESKDSLDSGNTPLIASGGIDNGLYDFCDIPAFYMHQIISVPRTGSIGQAFVQLTPCCVSSDSLVLTPKEQIGVEKLYQIAFQIRRARWKFSYGRKITPDRLKKERIRIEDDLNISFKEYEQHLMPNIVKNSEIRENNKLRLIPITELCNIERRTALPENQMNKDGSVPYITTTSKDNGVSEFVGEEPNSKGKCLTVALNGSCGQTFFQFDDFITSGDNAVLTLKCRYDPALLFYIGFQIYRQRWGFNYYRKLSEKRLKKFLIPMPMTSESKIDLNYIQKLTKNCYGYAELKKYL